MNNQLLRQLSIFILLLDSLAANAQIPSTSGIPLEWSHLFSYATGNSPFETSMYPEDAIFNNAGNPCFLHNTGLLEGSLFSELDRASGVVVNQRYNSVDELGFRLVGVALEKSPNTNEITLLGNRMISNSVQAIPPAGTFAWQKIENAEAISTLSPIWQEGGLVSRNDRGLPWIRQVGENIYWLAEPYVGTDNQTVAWIRSANGENGYLIDTISVIDRPIRNNEPVGNFQDYSRIRGFEQLPDGRILLLYAQQGNYEDTSALVNELIWMDLNGEILNRVDISAQTEFAALPNLLVADQKIFVYGAKIPFPSSSITPPEAGLAILTIDGDMIWSSGTNNGPIFRFSEMNVLNNGNLLFIETNTPDLNSLALSKWEIGSNELIALGQITFQDATLRTTCTKVLISPEQDLTLMIQMDKYDGAPSFDTDPIEVNHIAVAVDNTQLGSTSVKSEYASLSGFSIVPNPNHGRFDIRGLFNAPAHLKITDAYGRVIHDIPNYEEGHTDLPKLDTGTYWASIITRSGSQKTLKIVVLK